MERFGKYELSIGKDWVPLTDFLKYDKNTAVSSKRKSFNVVKVAKWLYDNRPDIYEIL